ncbi:nuclear transport factor 2 family protein [Nocardia sp. BMG51109]|uniref:nuclear transport factor 2 family protein n=1 Tax=Nocardia sp. BMG51109 TaxID=1056816 RepID=UPI000465DD93|nr:nuclear transport factor 2 family protein [Nocardia sp. BMG51109]
MTAVVHPHSAMLRTIYADLTQLERFATDDIVLHPADRDRQPRQVRGKHAVAAHEHALLDRTDNTLVMDVTDIVADDYFGAVLGTLRASRPRTIAVPFCGLWRFVGGRIAEHWENAHDLAALAHLREPK